MTKEEIASHFTDDAVYVNIPFPGQTVGGAAIAEVLHGPFMAKFARIDATVHHATSDGQFAFAERTERFTPRDGTAFELPVMSMTVYAPFAPHSCGAAGQPWSHPAPSTRVLCCGSGPDGIGCMWQSVV